jgi:hypothetical protein
MATADKYLIFTMIPLAQMFFFVRQIVAQRRGDTN